ncbi:MAG: ABC transporter transmembrane domain-containing protein, partial [Planctomycetota bacterium]
MRDVWRILCYARHYKGKVVVAVVLAFVVAVLACVQLPAFLPLFETLFGGQDPQKTLDWAVGAFPSLTSWAKEPLENFIADTLAGKPLVMLCWAVGLLIVLSLLKGLASFFQAYTVGKIRTGISRRIAGQLYEHMMGMSMSFYNRKGTASMTARFTNDVEALGRGLNTLFGKALVDPLKLAGLLTIAALTNWKLLLLNLALFPAIGIGIYSLGRKARRAMRKTLHSRDKLVNILQETFEGVSIVKAFNMQ